MFTTIIPGGRSDRRTPYAVLAAIALCTGCLGPSHSHPRSPGWQRELYSVRFDSAREIIIIPRDFAQDTIREMLGDVLELGGHVAWRSDTLVVEPYYITRVDAQHAHGRRTFRRGGRYDFPERAIIPIAPGMHVGDFRPPGSAPFWVEKYAIPVGSALIVSVFATYHVAHDHW
jgi:hypothetical protein